MGGENGRVRRGEKKRVHGGGARSGSRGLDALRLALAALASLGPVGCVQQTTKPKISFLPPGVAPKPDLRRPVAQPAVQATPEGTRTKVGLRRLGAVPFDSQTLPLTSPDGRWIATEHGAPPPWGAVLAAPGEMPPPGLRISAYQVARGDGSPLPTGMGMNEMKWKDRLPLGLLLGRSCDDRGFLVEAPQRDGSRWIGRVEWTTGRLEWLVRGTDPGIENHVVIAAFASYGPSGELAYSRLDSVGGAFDLIVRTRPEDPRTERVLVSADGSESYLCPTFSADRSHVYALAFPSAPGSRLSVLAVGVGAESDSGLTITSRAELNVEASMSAAFHTVLPLQTPWPSAGAQPPDHPLSSGLALVSLETGAMVWFDAVTGTLIPLARGTVAAAPVLQRSQGAVTCTGLVLGAAGELVMQSFGPTGFGAESPVISGPFLPRATTDTSLGRQHFILLAPPRPSAEPLVGVFEMTPVPAP